MQGQRENSSSAVLPMILVVAPPGFNRLFLVLSVS
jgi:hypothetical protein